MEQEKEKQSTTQMPDADDIIKAIKEIWRKGNASRLDIERQGRTLRSVSLVVGTIGFVLAPVAALIGLGTALITEYTIKITLDDGTIINVNEFALTRKKSSEQSPAQDAYHDYEKLYGFDCLASGMWSLMAFVLPVVLTSLSAYLLGSINSDILLCRLLRLPDIRQ